MFVRGDPAHLAAAYAALDRVAAFRDFRARFLVLPIWDDHDLGENDAGGDYPHKEDSERQFLEFWNISDDDPRARRPGLYRSWLFGPAGKRLQVVMLDTRYFRSSLLRNPDTSEGAWRYVPDRDPSKTMLGEAQWSWLREELSRPVDVRLVVSSVQVIADGHGKERWGNFPLERERLYELIGETRASGVILVSGDRHRAALYLKSSDVPYPLYELTSSSLNRSFADPTERGPYQLGETFGEDNFGTIELDWTDRVATLSVHDLHGGVVRSLRVDLDALSSK